MEKLLLQDSMQGQKHYQEKLFTSFQLSDRVPTDNFYRRLKEVLDLQWLYKATAGYYGTEGQSSIDPVVFFKLIIIGYLENQPGDRRIINTVSLRLDMLYFIGYDLDEPLPWHSTLSRTRQLYGGEVFRELFCKVLKQCIEKGMVAGRRQAIDSALIKANASMDSVVEKEILADAEVYTRNLKEEDEDNSSGGSTGGGRVRRNETHYSKTDPDAKLATKPGKPTQLNYLAQVSVDTASHVITNMEAHSADKRDSECLAEVAANTLSNLQPEGLIVEELLADTNYSSGAALEYLEDKNITGYIPNLGQYKPARKGFTYDKKNDQYICTKGTKIVFKKIAYSTDGHYNKIYSSSQKDCRHCELRSQCIGKSRYKNIYETTAKPFYDRMHQRMQTLKAKRMQKLRQTTVEPVLGTLINFLGMKRMNTRGLKQAGKCMIMAAIAYNLKKLLKFQPPKAAARVQKIPLLQSLSQKVPLFILGAPTGVMALNRYQTVLCYVQPARHF